MLQGPFINTAGPPTTGRMLGRRARGWPMGLHSSQSQVVKPGACRKKYVHSWDSYNPGGGGEAPESPFTTPIMVTNVPNSISPPITWSQAAAVTWGMGGVSEV